MMTNRWTGLLVAILLLTLLGCSKDSNPAGPQPQAFWTLRTSIATHGLTGVRYGDGRFAVVGLAWTDSTVATLTSPDGTTWTPNLYHWPDVGEFRDLIWTGTTFWAENADGLYASADGVTYTKSAVYTKTPEGICWTGTHIVCIDRFPTGEFALDTSRTGTAWGQVAVTPVSQGIVDLYAGGGVTVLVVSTIDSSTIYTSPNLVTWTKRFTTAGVISDVGWSGTSFIALAFSAAYASPTGTTWTPVALPSGATNLASIVWDGSRWVIAGFAQTYTSSDGVTWATAAGPSDYISRMAANGTTLVGVSSAGKVYSAPVQ